MTARDNLTNERTDLVTQHLKGSGRSEMLEQSLSSKYFLHDCVPKQHKSTSERTDSSSCVSSARSEAQVIHNLLQLLYIVPV